MIIKNLLGRIGPQRLINQAFRIRPNSDFIIFGDKRLTRRQVWAKTESLGAGLQTLGIKKGDHVATILPACPEAVCSLFLPHMIGSVNIPINPLLREEELKHILIDSNAKVVITTEKWFGHNYPEMLSNILPELPDLQSVIVIDPFNASSEKFLSLKSIIQSRNPLQPVKMSGEDITRIAYTSGTTGWPKGVVHNQKRAWGLAIRAIASRLDLTLMRCLLLPFPPYHFAGMLGIIVSLLSGGKVVLMDRFNPRKALSLIEKEKVSQFGSSPTMCRMILQTPGQEKYDLSSIKRVTFSTETCPYDLAQAISERFDCSIENIYSTTESNLISWTSLKDHWQRAATTVGKPVPGTEIRIVDHERNQLPIGDQGEIAVRTSQMMLGYYRDPDMTTQVLDEKNWYYTGDIGFMGEDGYLRLVDRKKDMIIRGGENISPVEIERFLDMHPAVRRSAVLGVLHPLSGETIWAYLELIPGMKLTSRQVLNYCRGKIAPFKIPERVHFVDRLPTTSTGKVQKYKLHKKALLENNHE